LVLPLLADVFGQAFDLLDSVEDAQLIVDHYIPLCRIKTLDLGKFPLGFDILDLPKDQWNIKFLLRQGPKDLRLFLSLFTQNAFGKALLPEIYYLGGIPLTEEVGRDTRHMIGKLAQEDAPFFLVSFMATTHPPFTSKYPYYSIYSDPAYRGESKFIMAKLRDPWELYALAINSYEVLPLWAVEVVARSLRPASCTSSTRRCP
jgi:hypothetical protein